jgi:hypothetical protein
MHFAIISRRGCCEDATPPGQLSSPRIPAPPHSPRLLPSRTLDVLSRAIYHGLRGAQDIGQHSYNPPPSEPAPTLSLPINTMLPLLAYTKDDFSAASGEVIALSRWLRSHLAFCDATVYGAGGRHVSHQRQLAGVGLRPPLPGVSPCAVAGNFGPSLSMASSPMA